MKYLDKVKSSLHKAGIETSNLMSAHLRAEAHASDWPEHIVNHLNVSYNNGEFAVHSHEDHRSEVLNLEYGTPDRQPTAVIRRLNNRTADLEKFLIRRAGHHMKGHA